MILESVALTILHDYFCGMAQRLLKDSSRNVDLLHYLQQVSVDYSFFFYHVDFIEITDSIQALKNYKSSGSDGISSKLLNYFWLIVH